MVVWQGITAGGTAVPVQVTESGEVVAATNTPIPGPEGPRGPEGPPGADGKDGAPGRDGDQWIEVNSRLIKPTNNVGIVVQLDAEFGGSITAPNITMDSNGEITASGSLELNNGNGYFVFQNDGALICSRSTNNWFDTAFQVASNLNSTGDKALFIVRADGQCVARGEFVSNGITLRLEPDNPDHYVSTTNAEGQTSTEYQGPELDVLQTLLTLLQKVELMEARLASTDSVLED